MVGKGHLGAFPEKHLAELFADGAGAASNQRDFIF
jgi:hypothetical protein